LGPVLELGVKQYPMQLSINSKKEKKKKRRFVMLECRMKLKEPLTSLHFTNELKNRYAVPLDPKGICSPHLGAVVPVVLIRVPQRIPVVVIGIRSV
jgi:hypothetical protein